MAKTTPIPPTEQQELHQLTMLKNSGTANKTQLKRLVTLQNRKLKNLPAKK